jgi:hypothetical protein
VWSGSIGSPVLRALALLPLRVRGLDRVALNADLTILAKLSCALARSRVVPSRRSPLTNRLTPQSIPFASERLPRRVRRVSACE